MKMRFLFLLTIILLPFLSPQMEAQYYDTGQDPASLRWMQIRTDRFRVIYPETYGTEGLRFAQSLEQAYSDLSALYPVRKFRLPVIIHNHTTWSNGYVAWAPGRMEIYPTPEQNTIPLDPVRQLAVHELTHVMQMESLERGTTKAISFLAGQQFPGAVASLLPFWFLEGDAVFAESVLTGSGRGRSPSFQKHLKAITVENERIFRYDKILSGSYRDFVPDHYETGFQMMAWSRVNYEKDLWEKTLRFTANAPFLINPVNLSLRKNASLTKKKLYNETLDSLKSIWNREDRLSGSESYEVFNPPKGKDYVSYYSPVIAGQDSIIAVRTSLSRPPSLVLIRPSRRSEERIYQPGNGYPWYISRGKDKLVWTETRTDPRWANRSWSIIRIMDLKSGVVKSLSRKTRYLSASVSPDGNFVATAENSVGNKNTLIILDAWNGNILKKVPVPGNASIQRPQWDSRGEKITMISLDMNGEGIMVFDTKTGLWDIVVTPGNADLQSTFLRNDSLFFVSSVSGTDNIYIRKPGGDIVPVTNSRFGANDLNINGNIVVFTDYGTSGNNICYTTLPGDEFQQTVRPSPASFLINRIAPNPTNREEVEQVTYNPVRYRKWMNLFRFHSWMPFYADLQAVQSDPSSIRPGLTLMTQNNLSTLISTLGYEYSDNRHKVHTNIKLQGWYLILESRLDYGSDPAVEKFRQQVGDPASIQRGYTLSNTLSLPLTFRGGYFTQNLYLSAASMYENNYLYSQENGSYDTGQNQLTARLYFANFSRSALRDIYPRWAQTVDFSFSSYPFDREFYGTLTTARTAFYFPGLLRNQGLKVKLEAEVQSPQKFLLSNRASFPRSYNEIISEDLRFVSGDYYFPLFYPDFGLPGILYLKRIRADLFYDHARATGNYVFVQDNEGVRLEYHDYPETFRSFGVELLSDFFIFRIPFMVSAGAQASWRNPGEAPFLKLLFNVDLFGMNIGNGRQR